ncbi:MAG: hypothetical protein HY039_00760, partial [Nitrospirae bacterium]|nr:hypothetical protein [Nitrospirota bacterium]
MPDQRIEGFHWTLRRKFLATLLVLVALAFGVGGYHTYRAFVKQHADAEGKVLDRAREMAL